MSQNTGFALEQLGRNAAEAVAGKDAVEQVEVVSGEDSSDRPVFYFSFLIDQERAGQRAGLVLTRLVQKLRDELLSNGYRQFPVIKILNREDWDKRTGA